MNKKLALMAACCAIASLSACNESVPWSLPGTDCNNEGARSCRNNAIVICQNGNFVVQTTCEGATPICDSTSLTCIAAAQDCTNGTRQCYGTDVRLCVDGKWTVETKCEGETPVCDSASLTCIAAGKDCADGTKQCYGTDVRLCVDGKWTVETKCEGETPVCDANTFECRANVCVNDDFICDEDNNLYVCSNEQWVHYLACNENQTCKADLGICATKLPCLNDEPVCSENKAINCIDEFRNTQNCSQSQVCVIDDDLAKCIDKVCDEDARRCNAAGNAETCIDNAWSEAECSETQVCSETQGCVTKICDEGASKCESNVVTACINNAWEDAEACGTMTCVVISDAAECVVQNCATGTMRCNVNVVESCGADLQWKESLVCTATQVCLESGGTAACQAFVCKTDDLRCNGNTLETCDANAWTTKQVCSDTTNYICVPGSEDSVTAPTCAAKVCDEGATRCNTGNANLLDTCTHNAWVTSTCAAIGGEAARCATSGGVGQCQIKVCDNGSQCVDNAVAYCSNNNFSYKEECELGLECKFDADVNMADCYPIPGWCIVNVCTGNVLQVCNKPTGVLGPDTPCHSAQMCDAANGVCKTPCAANICAAGNLQTCNTITGELGAAAACASSDGCLNATTCGDCKGSAYSCSGAILQRCVSGVTTTVSTCASAALCDAANGVCIGPCTDNVCSAGMLQTCSGGVLGSATACAGGADCMSVTACGNCSGSGYTCSGATLQQCVSGVTTTVKTCTGTTVCDATAGDCVTTSVCTEGDIRCETVGGVEELQLCDSGAWATVETCTGATPVCSVSDESCIASTITSYAITYAKTLGYDTGASVMWGEIYSSDSPANNGANPLPAAIVSQIVCTTDVATAALSTWSMVNDATFTGVYTGTGDNNYEFSGTIASATADRHCMMRFSGDSGTTWSYAAADGTLLTGATVLTVSSQAYFVAGSAPTWVHIEGFESLTPASAYNTKKEIPILDGSGLVTIGMISGASVNPTYIITGAQSLVVNGRSSDPTDPRLELTNVPVGKGIGKIAFDWRTPATSDAGNIYITVGTNTQTLPYSGQTTASTWEYDFNDATATSFAVTIELGTTTTNRRLIIDDVRWTYANP